MPGDAQIRIGMTDSVKESRMITGSPQIQQGTRNNYAGSGGTYIFSRFSFLCDYAPNEPPDQGTCVMRAQDYFR